MANGVMDNNPKIQNETRLFTIKDSLYQPPGEMSFNCRRDLMHVLINI